MRKLTDIRLDIFSTKFEFPKSLDSFEAYVTLQILSLLESSTVSWEHADHNPKRCQWFFVIFQIVL